MKQVRMPQIDWGEHLIASLFEFGPASSGMNGPTPVSFSEIEAWARTTNTQVPGYEALQLRTLSQDYCHQYYESQDAHCPPPGSKQERQDRVTQQMKAMLHG